MTVLITFLGHAGFCVETSHSIIIMDPWLSPTGAFDSAWFQFPRNHHLAAYVQEKLQDSTKERFIYISHEHKDHFDIGFLSSLQSREFTFIIPRFRRAELRSALANIQCKGIIACTNNQEIPIPGGFLKLYLDDSEINRDSAILVKSEGKSFLNLNDCKLYDQLTRIKHEEGVIDVFAAQFSGATWHPTCYEYPTKTYEAISRKKMFGKFETVARAIEIINPRVYLPSAGPACFLDPMLVHLNFQKINIFPRIPKLHSFLNRRLKNLTFECPNLMPGDVLDAESGTFISLASERVDDHNFEEYIRNYASLYEGLFRDRRKQFSKQETEGIMERLRNELEQKLKSLTLYTRVNLPLYFRLSDMQGQMLRVDFPKQLVEVVSDFSESNYYSITAPAWEVARVLDGKLTWEDFSLTFRMKLNREPDLYQAVIHGFLVMESEDMNWFCSKLLDIEGQQERIVVEAEGCKYAVNRSCPHQGADLSQGWIDQGGLLTCPRHSWKFNLAKGGQCTTNDSSINAIALEDV